MNSSIGTMLQIPEIRFVFPFFLAKSKHIVHRCQEMATEAPPTPQEKGEGKQERIGMSFRKRCKQHILRYLAGITLQG